MSQLPEELRFFAPVLRSTIAEGGPNGNWEQQSAAPLDTSEGRKTKTAVKSAADPQTITKIH